MNQNRNSTSNDEEQSRPHPKSAQDDNDDDNDDEDDDEDDDDDDSRGETHSHAREVNMTQSRTRKRKRAKSAAMGRAATTAAAVVGRKRSRVGTEEGETSSDHGTNVGRREMAVFCATMANAFQEFAELFHHNGHDNDDDDDEEEEEIEEEEEEEEVTDKLHRIGQQRHLPRRESTRKGAAPNAYHIDVAARVDKYIYEAKNLIKDTRRILPSRNQLSTSSSPLSASPGKHPRTAHVPTHQRKKHTKGNHNHVASLAAPGRARSSKDQNKDMKFRTRQGTSSADDDDDAANDDDNGNDDDDDDDDDDGLDTSNAETAEFVGDTEKRRHQRDTSKGDAAMARNIHDKNRVGRIYRFRKKRATYLPKKPPSAYILFVSSIREQVKEENPSLNNKEIVKICASRWRELSAGEREQYEDLYREKMEEYMDEKERRMEWDKTRISNDR